MSPVGEWIIRTGRVDDVAQVLALWQVAGENADRPTDRPGALRGLLERDPDALLVAARAGQGLVYEPSFILGDDLRAGSLVALTLDHPPVELDGVYVVYPSNRRPPARLRAFVDWIAERCAGVPPWDRGLPPG